MELSDRKLKILSAVIDNYILSAEPVSSKILCNLLDFSVSSATIRNELAELTELGFLEQPHTSAGRIPSHLGYRLYVNELMPHTHLTKKAKAYIDSVLEINLADPELILKSATHLLARLTNCAVISTNVSTKKNYIRNLKLVQISSCTAMLILSTSSGIVKNRVFRCEFLLTAEIIITINQILNELFAGVLLEKVTPAFIQTIAVSFGELAFVMSDVLNALLDISISSAKIDFHFDGQTNLLLIPEFNQQSAIKLMNFFTYSDDISNLFMLPENSKTRVFIGEESPYEELSQSSIIVTKYFVNGENYGSLGIVGPTRMNYSGLIANLEYIASLLGSTLNKILSFE